MSCRLLLRYNIICNATSLLIKTDNRNLVLRSSCFLCVFLVHQHSVVMEKYRHLIDASHINKKILMNQIYCGAAGVCRCRWGGGRCPKGVLSHVPGVTPPPDCRAMHHITSVAPPTLLCAYKQTHSPVKAYFFHFPFDGASEWRVALCDVGTHARFLCS